MCFCYRRLALYFEIFYTFLLFVNGIRCFYSWSILQPRLCLQIATLFSRTIRNNDALSINITQPRHNFQPVNSLFIWFNVLSDIKGQYLRVCVCVCVYGHLYWGCTLYLRVLNSCVLHKHTFYLFCVSIESDFWPNVNSTYWTFAATAATNESFWKL